MYSPPRSLMTSPFPSPPLAPIAEAESSDVASEARTPQNSEEMHRALQLVPPSDSMLEVHAIPAEGVVDEESATPPATSPRRIIFPITPFYGRKEGCSKCNLWLGLFCVLFFLLSIALFLVWAITSRGFSNLGGKSEVCSSRECINTAFRMSSYMDESIEPCDNFLSLFPATNSIF